ncbi:MAG TPA: UvrD-helicase domain-containing protein [Clostridiales bacterium]|nr:UvrD-helicase domain-containing protein [Clostridiales bacterium]
MAWTKAQQKVIDTRNKDLLVSAAAGSGKTAVLVERIISMISEGDKPIDIDRLLVVTFTNAAAAEMRDRIGIAIEKKLLQEPDNAHLQKQVSLLQSAHITTIHSFCLNVIRNYFHRIDLDPSFKIAEESEITLMKSDVVSHVLEAWYEEERPDFHKFIESYSYSKSDGPIEDLILKMYSFAMSAPWPEKWIEQAGDAFDMDSIEAMNSNKWMSDLLNYVKTVIADLIVKNGMAIDLCNGSGGPTAYLTALVSDSELLEGINKASTYEGFYQVLGDVAYARLSSKREEGVDPDIKERVKALRDEIKKAIKDLVNQFFYQTPEEMVADITAVGDVIEVLFELTVDFMKGFADKKEEKNIIDFNDIEHFALRILVEDDEGTIVPTEAALELSEQFVEILIDEYQDSNLVQETILKSISRERNGEPNRFMVGDVKQSIYKFRLAMPELFMEKYKSYSVEDTLENGDKNLYQRIDLDKNFRSRKIVLDYVNIIFEQIMQESVGGVAYDEKAALSYGELYDEYDRDLSADEVISDKVELLLVTDETSVKDKSFTRNFVPAAQSLQAVTKGIVVKEDDVNYIDEEALDIENRDDDAEDSEDDIIYTKKEMEALVIARRIKELVNPDTGISVYDKKLKKYRMASYKDIVILLRSMTGWSEIFVNTLAREGISAYADTGTGYFQTVEIMNILNYLRIIDNPRQDIPLVGVLYSPIVGMTTRQLSKIRAFDKNSNMYTAIISYATDGDDEDIKNALTNFIEQLNGFRSIVNHTPINELLSELLNQNGYSYYVSAMPGGERRKANIEMLVSKAVQFEKGSYSGLFHFIRYIEKLHKYEVDFGEASTSGEQDDTVRIMSIHKSKGLEFPIVFVSGMSKQFNMQDVRSNIILHNELGVGPDYIDVDNRTKVATLLKKVIQKKVQIENLGEELRVLYVAMTRAKEKLIMTGYLKSTEDSVKDKCFTFFELITAKSYLDLILPAMLNRIERREESDKGSNVIKDDYMKIEIINKESLISEEVNKQVFINKDREKLESIKPDKVYDQELRDEIHRRLEYLYPYENESNLRVKMSVSELKRMGQFIDQEDESLILYPDTGEERNNRYQNILETDIEQHQEDEMDDDFIPEFTPTIPNFISKKETDVSGADKGTLYHKVLKLLDLSKAHNIDDVNKQISAMVLGNKIEESHLSLLNLEYIYNFINSKTAKRMAKAQLDNRLYKEQQFVIGIKANEVGYDVDSDELVLIQGIIDAFFEEDKQLVLVDYKSDWVRDEQTLIERYKVQLDYYQKALEQIFKKEVKERIIYSLILGREIYL